MFFKSEHFKTSLPVALTSMLVMYTLNQSISAKLPTTSYVKFIDIWLMFGLVQPFVICVMLVLIEHLPGCVVNPSNEKIRSRRAAVLVFLKAFAQLGLPALEIIFVGIYCAIAINYYRQ